MEPPMIHLGERKPLNLDALPNLKQHAEAHGIDLTLNVGSVLGTRDAARRVVDAHPAAFAGHTLYLNVAAVEIATPSFFDELFRVNQHIQLVGASEDVQQAFDLVKERYSA